MSDRKQFTIENARIIFRNFGGEEKPFNAKGIRNFCVVIPDEETAEHLSQMGFNIKVREPKEEGDEPFLFLKVKVRFDTIPPKITMLTDNGHGGKKRTILTEDMVSILDYSDIEYVDVIITGSDWRSADGKTGTSAYLKTMFVTIDEDDLERKYADVEGEGVDI